MTIRGRINHALTKSTGYQIVRAHPQQAEPREPAKKAPAKAPEKEPVERTMPTQRAKVPSDYDEETAEIWDAVRLRTMTRHERVESLITAVRYVERYQVPGAIVECGVWRGGSMLACAHTLLRRGATERDLYLFDTFTGMSEPTNKDVRISQGKTAAELMEARGPGPLAWNRPERWVATLEDVKEGFAELDYPEERLHFVPGKVEETVPDQAPDTISILRLDTDWYESTKHELDHLYQRLSPGGVLIIDDYGTWQGSKQATDEFLDEVGDPLLMIRVARARFAVKPGLPTSG
jgi:hypothetical protein